MKDNPVLQCLDKLKQLEDDSCKDQPGFDKNLEEMGELFDKLTELCGAQGSGNAAIATRNGGLELVCSICSKIRIGSERALASALKAMAALLHGMVYTHLDLTVFNFNAILICLHNELNLLFMVCLNKLWFGLGSFVNIEDVGKR